MIISIKHLPRDLKIIGVLSFIFAIYFFAIYFSTDMKNFLSFVNSLSFLSMGIIYFSLAVGISRKEKLMWIFGVIIFSLIILISLISSLLKITSIFQLIVGIFIPALFLVTFIQGKREIAINNNRNINCFFLFILGFIINLVSGVYLIAFSKFGDTITWIFNFILFIIIGIIIIFLLDKLINRAIS